MDRKNISKNGIAGVFCATAMLLIAAQSFGAVTNSFFDTSLSGWETNSASGVVWSAVNLSNDGTGSAKLQQYGTLSESPTSSQLWQRMFIDAGSQSLTFTVRTPQTSIAETDYLNIGLFDDSSNSLLADPTGFFHWNSDAGEGTSDTQYFTLEAVSDTENSWMLYNFTVPVESWNNDYVTLRFQLDNCLDPDDPITTVWVDNAELHGTSTTPVVPVPGALGLVLAGLAALGVFRRKLA
jgi:hypothetical protein